MANQKLDWSTYQQWLQDALVCEWVSPKTAVPRPENFSTDSRKIKAGDFFIALKGENFDGHQFIKQSLEKGATGFLYDNESALAGLSAEQKKLGIQVKNSLTAMQHIARGWRRLLGLRTVIALTGSVGKTTAKEMLASILSKAGPTLSTQESFNNEIGLPLTLFKLNETHEFAVLEMGARHVGDIKFLCEIAEPNIACLLNVTNIHLAEFGSVENIVKTKSEIFSASAKDAILVTNFDDSRLTKNAKQTNKKLIAFGSQDGAQVQLDSTKWLPDGGMEIGMKISGEKVAVKLKYAHQSYPINACATMAAALAAGLNIEKISQGFLEFKPASGRFEVYSGKNLVVIDDSYNAGPDSMASGLRTAIKLFPNKKKIAVLGDMKELGEESEKSHLAIGALCQTEFKPDLLITVGQESLKIAEGAMKAGLAKDKVLSFSDVDQAIRLPERVYLKRELAYVKGSHALNLNKLVAALRKLG